MHAVTGRPDPFGFLPSDPLHQVISTRHADVKILCQDGIRTDPALARVLGQLARVGAHVATVPAPPPAVVIADRRAAIVAIPGSDAQEVAVLVHDPSLTGYLAATVDSFWATATPLNAVVPQDENGLTPEDRALLRLLADGMTQQDAATRIHRSPRTVSRRTRELKHRLNAASPLQAGLEAARRGWL